MSSGPRWSVEGRGWPLAEHSRFIAAGGMRWHVQRWGAGPPILLLHGTGAATHSWRGLAPLLAERHEIVAIDLPGHGFTTGRPVEGLTLPGVAGAVRALIGTLEVRPALIVGHSAGAAVAIRMALDGVSARGLVGLSPALQPFPGVAAFLFPTLARMLFVNPFAAHIFAAVARRPGEVGRFLARSTGSAIEPGGVDLYARLFATAGHVDGALRMMAEWDLAPLAAGLPELTMPLLLIHGAGDTAIPETSARRSAAAVPGSRIEVLPGLGHLAHEERPELVAELIERFAAQVGVA